MSNTRDQTSTQRAPTPPGFLGWVGALVHAHRASLVRVARHEGVDAEDAFDVVQEAFHAYLDLPLARALYESEEDSAHVLSAVTRNLARNRRRRHDRARAHVDEPLETLADPTPTVEELIARAEAHVRLIGCVAQLGRVQKAVVTLRMLDERDGEDTARALAMTPNHVAVALRRAKAALRACLERAEEAVL